MEGDPQSNGHRRAIELEVTGEDLSAVLRMKMAQISQLELQVMALSRLLGDRDSKLASLEAQPETNSKTTVT